jgi:hypothetical protein
MRATCRYITLTVILFLSFSSGAANRTFLNPSFDSPANMSSTTYCSYYDGNLGECYTGAGKSEWLSANRGIIEIWPTGGYESISANRALEILSKGPDFIYQEIDLSKGELISWSFDHAARKATYSPSSCLTPSGEQSRAEEAQLVIESADGTKKQVLATASSNVKGAWKTYTGSAAVLVDSGRYRVGFRSVVPSAGSCGNLIDNAQISFKAVPTGGECELNVDTTAGRYFLNSSFDSPANMSSTTYCSYYDGNLGECYTGAGKSEWLSANRGIIEIWPTGGYESISANRALEILSKGPDFIYQEINVKNGETISWKFDHAARKATYNPSACSTPSAEQSRAEEAQLVIESADGTKKQVLATASSNVKGDWKTYTGSTTVTVPTGKYRIGVRSVVPSAGSCGNLIDNVQIGFGSLICETPGANLNVLRRRVN